MGGGGESRLAVNTGRGRLTGHRAERSLDKRFKPSPTGALA